MPGRQGAILWINIRYYLEIAVQIIPNFNPKVWSLKRVKSLLANISGIYLKVGNSEWPGNWAKYQER